jgi:endoglucanase Acf2
LKTAAILAEYDRDWGDESALVAGGTSSIAAKYGDLIRMVVQNVANTDRNNPRFPFLRNFDVLQGHSWADGAANDPEGTNQESSSESLNFASGLMQWGEVTGDKALRGLGIDLYETEIESVATYYFNVNQTDAFPDAFRFVDGPNGPVDDRPVIPFPHNASGAVGGFVGSFKSAWSGIQMLPFSGGAYYLGRDPAFVERLSQWALSNSSPIGQVPIRTPDFLSFVYPYYALSDPDQAISLYQTNLAKICPKNNGLWIDTAAFNMHWMQGLQMYGQVDTSVVSGASQAMVFTTNPADPMHARSSPRTVRRVPGRSASGPRARRPRCSPSPCRRVRSS